MFRHLYRTQFLSVFLIAFVCLNVGGTLCVAYCQGFEIADELKQIQAVDHCNKADHEIPEHFVSSSKNEMDCCPMTVSIVSSPIETSHSGGIPPAALSVTDRNTLAFSPDFRYSPQTVQVYRGPPKDRRPDRIKHGVLRI